MTPASHVPSLWRRDLSRALALMGLTSIGVVAIVVCTGGFEFDLIGVRVSARSPAGPLVAALVAATLAWLLSPAVSGRRDVIAWMTGSTSLTGRLAAILALATIVTGMAGGLETAGSADATGYVSSSRLIASGRLWREEPLGARLAFHDAARVLTPLGFKPSPDAGHPERQAPTYPPGLPLLMAVASWFAGASGAFLVVSMLGGAAVWLVFALGRAVKSPGAGLAAAVLLATQPAFLFQLLQPMSDVPVTAAWLASALAALTGRHGISGAAAGLAILIRPNLLLMAGPIAWYAATLQGSAPTLNTAALRRWLLACAVPVVVLAALNTVWYGAPWRFGYGEAASLFAPSSVWPNLAGYGDRLIRTSGAWCLPLAIALVWPLRFGSSRRPAAMLSTAALINIAVYLPYYPFAEWHYLRFLLPGLALLLPASAEVVRRVFSASGPRLAVPLTLLAVLLQAGWQLTRATDLDVFRLTVFERRYALTATWLREHTEPDAVIVCAQQSGSVALNVPRSIARWDLAPDGSLDALVDALRASGRPVWLLVESWESADFAMRHGTTTTGMLDWPPAAVITSAVKVQVHRVADRTRFRAGDHVDTQYLSDPVAGRSRRFR